MPDHHRVGTAAGGPDKTVHMVRLLHHLEPVLVALLVLGMWSTQRHEADAARPAAQPASEDGTTGGDGTTASGSDLEHDVEGDVAGDVDGLDGDPTSTTHGDTEAADCSSYDAWAVLPSLGRNARQPGNRSTKSGPRSHHASARRC